MDVEINYKLPYVAVGDKFFVQGEEAEELIEEAEKIAERENLTTEEAILEYLSSAGAI